MRAAARACALILVAGLAVASCAGGDDGGPARDPSRFGGSEAPGEGPGGVRSGLNVFISPSGEPFRACRDAAYASALWFARADTDHDGRLTLAEFRADALRAFALFDTNGDGVIDAFEIQYYEQAIAPEILPSIGGLRAGEGMDDTLFKPGRGGGRRGGASSNGSGGGRRQIAADRDAQGGGLYGMLAEPEPLTAADTDLSGSVTKAEWMSRTDRRFALLDTNAAGFLTLATLPRPQAQLLLERRRQREAAAARHALQPR